MLAFFEQFVTSLVESERKESLGTRRNLALESLGQIIDDRCGDQCHF